MISFSFLLQLVYGVVMPRFVYVKIYKTSIAYVWWVLSHILSDLYLTGKSPGAFFKISWKNKTNGEALLRENKSITLYKNAAEINSFQYQPTVTDSLSSFEAKWHQKLKWTLWNGLNRL